MFAAITLKGVEISIEADAALEVFKQLIENSNFFLKDGLEIHRTDEHIFYDMEVINLRDILTSYFESLASWDELPAGQMYEGEKRNALKTICDFRELLDQAYQKIDACTIVPD